MKDAESITLSNFDGLEVPKKSIGDINFPMQLPNMLKELGIVVSSSDGRRRIKAGSVRLDGVKILDDGYMVVSKEEIVGKVIQFSKTGFYLFCH